MQIKISFKDGEKSHSFKFAGDLGDIFSGLSKCVGDVVVKTQKFFEDDGPRQKDAR